MAHTKSTPGRTPAQNRAIWGLKSQLERAGLAADDAEATVRRVCAEVSGQEHTSRLTPTQAGRVIDQLQRLVQDAACRGPATRNAEPAPHTPWGPRGPGPREAVTISGRQQEVLQAVFRQAGMRTPEQQRGFAMRQCKRPWAQTQRDYDKLIEALYAIVLREVTPAQVLARARALVGHPRLDAWQERFIPNLVEQLEGGGGLSTHKLAKLVEAELRCGVCP
jgi:hypothetical protein